MSSVVAAGDHTPPPAHPAPIAGSDHGCSSCAPAPAVHADCCGSSKMGILDRIKGKFGKKKCGPSCAPACESGCASSGCSGEGCAAPLPHDAHPVTPGTTVPSTMPAPTAPPKEMPKPKEPAKEPAKGNSTAIPIPMPPITGAGLTTPASRY
jgi:hypothetical protein